MAKTRTYLGVTVAAYLAGGISCWLVNLGTDSMPAAQSPEVRQSAGDHEVVQPREFIIDGMACPSCVGHLTSELTKVPGVESAKVSLQGKKAVIVARESQVPTEKILAVISEAGYQGRLAPTERSTPTATADACKQQIVATGSSMTMQPIGLVHSPYKEAKGTPIQGVFDKNSEAWVELNPEYVKGLKDLDGFSHAILLYQFHLSNKVEMVGKPYLENEEHGIFAMRSPHRPNHIGLSMVKIKRVDGNKVHFTEVDILDGTPVLDIKPYVKQFDCRDDAVSGWIERHFKEGKQPDVTTAK